MGILKRVRGLLLVFGMAFGTSGFSASPVVESVAITTATQDSIYSYELHASDVDGDSLSWSVKGNTAFPSWLSLTSLEEFKTVGTTGFSAGLATYLSLDLDNSDTPYVAYSDGGNENKATVMKFDGSAWKTVGSAGFSTSDVIHLSMALDSSGTPYVVYSDSTDSYSATVKKFNGTAWQTVGTTGFSAGQAYNTFLAFDSLDTPYVVYTDHRNDNQATVMQFDGTAWQIVGSAGFSAGTISSPTLAFDSYNVPYVAYKDGGNGNKATVMQFDGTAWKIVGSAGFSADTASNTSIALDSNDTPYVVYGDNGNSYKATVKKFDGTAWQTVGVEGFSAASAYNTSLAIDSSDTPYVVYGDDANRAKAIVKKFDGTAWRTVGTDNFSVNSGNLVTMALDSSNTPYIAYMDYANDKKATVVSLSQKTTLNGTPTNADVGTHNISLTLSDGNGANVDHNFTITVTNVNDIPTSANASFTIDEDENKTFVTNDFNFTDVDAGATLNSIFITTLPNTGVLTLNDVNVTLNQEITNIADLKFTPVANANGTPYTNFGFKVNDGDVNSTSAYTATINVTAVDDAPTLEAIANVLTLEDADDLNITLVSNDVEGNPITYIVNSSNTEIATVAIVDGKLVVTQVADAYGLVNIEVNATSNGLSVLRDFNLTVSNLNDAPTIDTTFENLNILEDARSFSVDMNVSDRDGDDLNLTVESNNTALLAVTQNYTNLLNQGSYDGVTLDFNLTAQENANGIAEITLTLNDGTTTRTKTFDVNVTAVNDAVIINANVKEMSMYKNFDDEVIELNIEDPDNTNHQYSLSYDTSVLRVNAADGNLTLRSISEAKGTTDINLTISDGDSNATLNFKVGVISLRDDDNIQEKGTIEKTEANGVTATTITVQQESQEDIVVKLQESNTEVKHIVSSAGRTTEAISSLVGAVVEIIESGVKTSYGDALVSADILGKARHQLIVDTKLTEAKFEQAGVRTLIDKDSNGDVEIVSEIVIDDRDIKIIAKADGSSEQTVTVGEKTSKLVSVFKGTKTLVKLNGDIETLADAPSDSSNRSLKIKTISKVDGSSSVLFISISKVDETDSVNLTKEMLLPQDTSLELIAPSSKPMIKATLSLENRLKIH